MYYVPNHYFLNKINLILEINTIGICIFRHFQYKPYSPNTAYHAPVSDLSKIALNT